MTKNIDIAKLKSSDFQPYLNQTFYIHSETLSSMPVELVEIDNPSCQDPETGRPFSLLFQTTQMDEYLRQRMYVVEHEHMGEMQLFIVCIGPNKAGNRMSFETVLG